jgi:hypothetical protein
MLVVVSIGTFTFCSLEYLRIHKSGDKFANMQSYGFDPEAISAPVYDSIKLEFDSTNTVSEIPEPLMKSAVEPQLSSVSSTTTDESDYEYKFDESKKAFIKYKKTEDKDDHYSKYLQFMKDTYDIDLNEDFKDDKMNVDIKEMIKEQPILEASSNAKYADMIKNK